MSSQRRFRILVLFLVLLVVVLAPGSIDAAKPPPPQPVTVRLTSITIDPEDASGTTNAPGAWSTNLADPLSQVGVVSQGKFQNIPGSTFALGEIDIPLAKGNNVFTLYGTGIFPANTHYGAVLFFDGQQVNPQIAVYNVNGGAGAFSVRRCPPETVFSVPPAAPAPCVIMGGANGGWFFDYSPGTHTFVAKDGSTVEVTRFTINALDSAVDKVGHYDVGPDGTPDAVAKLHIRVTPAK